MEEKPQINHCHDSSLGNNIGRDLEIIHQEVIIENDDHNDFKIIAQPDGAIYNEDIGQTFSENKEVNYLNLHKEMPVELKSYELVDFTKVPKNVHFYQDEQSPDSDVGSSLLLGPKSNIGVEFNPDDTYNVMGEMPTTEHENELYKEMTPVSIQSLVSLLIEPNIPEMVTNEVNAETIRSLENDDAYCGTEAKIVQVNDAHKEFIVQNVDESQLALEHETMNAKLTIKDNIFASTRELFTKAPSSPVDEVLPGTDINNQDTIGPLDNPAFLRKLHYTVGYQSTGGPPAKDDLPGLKSNIDLTSLSELEDPPDLDKGWAWVVLFAGFTINTLLGATIYAAGVLLLAVLRDIEPNLTKASWIGSLYVCSMCLSGPFVEIATRQFGTRITVFCAGIVTSVGFIGASFAKKISGLILTHGLIAGVGSGFIASPISVSVGQYFNKYRGLACGLMATGAGIGMLTGGAFISVLLEEYGLSGTYLIWAGVLLHTAVLAMLLRPSPEERLRTLEKKVALRNIHQQPNTLHDVQYGLNSAFGSMDHSMLSGIDKISYGKRLAATRNFNKTRSAGPETPLLSDGHEMSHLTPNQRHLNSHFQPHKFVLGDQQYMSLAEIPTATPKINCPNALLCNQCSLANRVQHYGSANIVTVSNLTHVSPNIPSLTSKSTNCLDKIDSENRCTGHLTLGKIINRDQIAIQKPFLHHELSNSSHGLATNQSNLKHRGTSFSLLRKFSKSFGLGDRQLEFLSTSPFDNSKPNSPPMESVSEHTLTSEAHISTSSGNVQVVLDSDQTKHGGLTSSSRPISPRSIQSHQSPNHCHHLSQSSLSQNTSVSRGSLRLSYRGSHHRSHFEEMDSESITSALVSQPRPRDVMTMRYPLGSRSISTLMGSIPSIPIGLAIVKDDVSRYETLSITGVHEKGFKGRVIRILDSMRLLRRTPFVIFLAVCFLWSFGEAPVMIYLPSYAISLGTSPILASMLYTAMGSGSILGRFLSGLAATDSNIGPAILFTGCLGVAGLSIAIGPLIISSFIEQIIFSCLAGIYTGALVPLSSLIILEMLEIGELGIGFGFISLAQGCGYLIGPPLASLIVEAIGYTNSFMFSGLVLMTGSGMAISMTSFLRKMEEEEEDNHNQKYDLMKVLQKMTEDNQEITVAGPADTTSEAKEISKVVLVDKKSPGVVMKKS